LSHAAAEGDVAAIHVFQAPGASVDARTADGSTALHAAAVTGQLGVTEMLLSRGADPNAVNRSGDSPLASAEFAHQSEVARVLRERGARWTSGTEAEREAVGKELRRRMP
jgi:uncharacterized protein